MYLFYYQADKLMAGLIRHIINKLAGWRELRPGNENERPLMCPGIPKKRAAPAEGVL
jgi:hypothetical protein